MKDSLQRNWWKLLRGNEIVNKLRRFVDFGVLLNYNFELRTFPLSAAQIVANRKNGWNQGKMGGSFKNSRIPKIGGRVASCYLLVLGDGKERQGQVYFTRLVLVCKGFSEGRLFSRQANKIYF